MHSHEDEPAALYRPDEQFVHTAAPTPLHWPAAHDTQFDAPVLLLYWPDAQLEQLLSPDPGPNCPTPHGLHDPDDVVLLNWPIGHATHAVVPPGEY